MEEIQNQTEQTETTDEVDYKNLYEELTTRYQNLEEEKKSLSQKITKLTNDLNESHKYILYSGREPKPNRYDELKGDIL